MQPSYTLEIVPLVRTDTGLRLRAEIMNAQEYDVVLRREGDFLWRRPAGTLAEAEEILVDARNEYGENLVVEGDVPLAETAADLASSLRM